MHALERVVIKNRKLRPRTRQLYLQHVRTFLEVAGSGDLKTDSALKYIDNWRTEMVGRGVAPQSVNVALNALRFAVKKAGYTYADEIKTVPVADSQTESTDRALTWDEGSRLLNACATASPRDLRDTAIITLGLRTGMLRFSLCQLKIEDLVGDTLTFIRKGGHKQAIKLDPCTLEAIANWRGWLSSVGITTGALFRNLSRVTARSVVAGQPRVEIGDQLTPDGLYRALKLRAKYAGIEGINPHVFRRTFLEWAKKAGATGEQLVAVTGHKADGNGILEGKPSKVQFANFLLKSW